MEQDYCGNSHSNTYVWKRYKSSYDVGMSWGFWGRQVAALIQRSSVIATCTWLYTHSSWIVTIMLLRWKKSNSHFWLLCLYHIQMTHARAKPDTGMLRVYNMFMPSRTSLAHRYNALARRNCVVHWYTGWLWGSHGPPDPPLSLHSIRLWNRSWWPWFGGH